MDYRALAMPFLMENFLNQAEAIRTQGVFSTANAADRPLAVVATRDMAAAQNDGIYDAEQSALSAPAPTGFRQWCQDVLKPAVLA
ncbi:hypothetical protein OG389_34830 [Streptomyces sp. NBC_00435]|uniref:hypothetical protein n=1 Tax=Streptomyces sp. NBC_00435 TaxID=2903649 RepID=UPI002E22E00B